MDNTKALLNKIFICLIAILTVLIINTMMLAAIISNKNNNDDNTQESLSSYDVSKFKEVSAKDLINNTKGSNTVVYIGRETCSWCVKFVSVLNEALDNYKLNILYIDIAKIMDFSNGSIIDQESYDLIASLKTVSSLDGYMAENFGATPMVLIIKDGKIIDAQTGYVELETFSTFLDKNEFVVK